MTNATVSNDSSNVPESTAAFFAEVQNGRDETTEVSGGYGSYPKIRVVTLGDDTFYGFTTSLDESRGPWLAGYRDAEDTNSAIQPPVWFDRDTVFNAETLETVAPNSAVAAAVNALIECDNGTAMTDGGVDESEDDDELGPLFG
jgi:hypothetical protein